MGQIRPVSQESLNLLTLKMTERAAVAGPFHAIAFPLIVAALPNLSDKWWAWWSSGALVLVAAFRIVIWYFTKRLLPTPRGRWIHRLAFGTCSLALALAWSVPTYLVMSQFGMNIDSCVLVIGVFGVAAIAVPAFSSDLAVIIAFLKLAIWPIVVGLGMHYREPGYTALAVGLILYDIFMSFLAVHINRSQINNVRQVEEISSLHRTLETMVESLGEAFLLIDRQGRFRATTSKRALELLGSDPSHREIGQVLRISPDLWPSLQDWVTLCFEDRFDFEDIAALGPQQFVDTERKVTLELRYRALRDARGVLRSIVMIGRDISRELQAQRRADENNIRAEMILTVLKNPSGFREFQTYARSVFEGMSQGTFASMSALRMDLHTLKGSAGLFRMVSLSEKIHQVEHELRQFDGQLLKAVDRERISIFGGESLKVLEDWLETERDFVELARSIPDHNNWDLGSYLETFASAVAVTAQRLHKKVRFEVKSEQAGFVLPLKKGQAPAPLRTLIHVFNNAIDHGIETPDMRSDRGKSVEGMVSVGYRPLNDEKIGIWIRDDGAGINAQALRQALRRKNVLVPEGLSDRELFQYVFDEGLSTRQEVTEISGHGVGMSAVKASVEKAGGRIEVLKSDRHGTEIFLELPFSAFRDEPRAVA